MAFESLKSSVSSVVDPASCGTRCEKSSTDEIVAAGTSIECAYW